MEKLFVYVADPKEDVITKTAKQILLSETDFTDGSGHSGKTSMVKHHRKVYQKVEVMKYVSNSRASPV